MRALSAQEVALLAEADPMRACQSFHFDAAMIPVMDALVARGCMTRHDWRDDKGDMWAGYDTTDLGRLALRVAAALPPLGLP